MHRNPVKLPDMAPEIYPVYHEWLYRKQICIKDTETDVQPTPSHGTWVLAYFFGRIIEDNKFCQAILKAAIQLCKESNSLPSPDVVEYAYKKSCKKAPIRNFLDNLYNKAPLRMMAEHPQRIRFPDELVHYVFIAGPMTDRKSPAEWDVEKVKEDICLDIDHINPHAS